MAERTIERLRDALRVARRGLPLLLALGAAGAQAGEVPPHAVIVTPGASYESAINEDGIVEANAARVENGIVHLEFLPPPVEALTVARH